MSKWDKLSMADRAKYIKLAVQNKVTSLGTIREVYNKYDEGSWLKDISDIEGNIVLRDTEGNRTFYNSAQEAMKAMGDGYSYKRIDSNFGYDGTGYTDNRGHLPTVDVVAQVPKAQLNKALIDEKNLNKPTLTIENILENAQSKPEINDPIRNGIFEGRYGTTKFTPTDENIRRYLDIYEADKKVGEGYGMHQWGKVAKYMGEGAAAALGLAAAAPIVGAAMVSPAGQTLIGEAAGGMATNLAANELYKGITGSNQGYMADAADWIADQYQGSMLQDLLNSGGIYLPGDREDLKTVMEYLDPAYTEGALIDKSIAAVSNSMKGIGNIRIRPKGEFVRTLHTKNGDSSLEAIKDAFNTGTIRANQLKLLNNTISSPSTVNRMGIHNIRSMRNKVKTFFNFLRGEQIANKLNAKAESFYDDIISKRDGILESTPLFNDNNKPIVMSSSLGEKDGTPILGVHKRNSGRNYVSTSILDKNERIMTGIHEAVSHGTDHLIPEEQKQFYNKMLESLGLDSFVHKGSKLWEELRATKNEILHSLYKNNRDNKSIIKAVDNLSDTDLLRLLRGTNGYGRDYNRALKDKYKAFSEIPPSEGYDFTKENPFLDNLRHTLKYFPSVIGLGLGVSALDE